MQKELRCDLFQPHSKTTNKEVILKFKENRTLQMALIFEHKSLRFRERAGCVMGISKGFGTGRAGVTSSDSMRFLFIYCLFNDPVSSSGYIASNGWMIRK
jgi:hypothetical protein